jgi:hypothetical protein
VRPADRTGNSGGNNGGSQHRLQDERFHLQSPFLHVFAEAACLPNRATPLI